MPQFCKIYRDTRNAKPPASSLPMPGSGQWLTGEQSTTLACSGKPGVLDRNHGTSQPCSQRSFLSHSKNACVLPWRLSCTTAIPPLKGWRFPWGKLFVQHKILGRPTRHWPQRSGKDKAMGGKCTKEEKSHSSMLELVSRKAPSLPSLLLPAWRKRNKGL